MNHIALLVLAVLCSELTFSKEISEKPIDLFNDLHSNEEWEILNSIEDISIYTKKIKNKELMAVMVSQELSLPKKMLQSVVMDVGRYGDFLQNSGSFISQEIKKTSSFVEGYQFIPIQIPFFDNREYIFRMFPTGYNKEDRTSIIHWFLLNEDTGFLAENKRLATYLDYGAGLWVAEKIEDSRTNFSYRLYMDPGGSIPNFLVNTINKTSVINIFKDAVAEAQKRYESLH